MEVMATVVHGSRNRAGGGPALTDYGLASRRQVVWWGGTPGVVLVLFPSSRRQPPPPTVLVSSLVRSSSADLSLSHLRLPDLSFPPPSFFLSSADAAIAVHSAVRERRRLRGGRERSWGRGGKGRVRGVYRVNERDRRRGGTLRAPPCVPYRSQLLLTPARVAM